MFKNVEIMSRPEASRSQKALLGAEVLLLGRMFTSCLRAAGKLFHHSPSVPCPLGVPVAVLPTGSFAAQPYSLPVLLPARFRALLVYSHFPEPLTLAGLDHLPRHALQVWGQRPLCIPVSPKKSSVKDCWTEQCRPLMCHVTFDLP